MAFGFIKKVFSFGKKEVVEEKVDETAPLPPLNFDALEALKPAAEQVVPDFLKREEQAEVAPIPEPVAQEPEKVEPEAFVEAPVEQPIEAIAELQAPVELEEPVVRIEEPAVVETAPEPVEDATPVEATPEPEPEPEVREPVSEQPDEVGAEPIEVEQAEVAEPEPVVAEPMEPEPVVEIGANPETDAAEPVSVAPEGEPEVAPAELQQPETQPAQEEPAAEEAPAQAIEPEIVVEAVPEAQPEAAAETVEAEPTAEAPAPTPEEAPKTEAVEPPAPVAEPVAARSTAGKVTVSKKVEQKAEAEKAPEPVAKRSWFQRMREGLARSSRELSGNIAGVFTKRKLDEETLQDLEDVLIRADLGVETALRVTDSLASSRYGKDVSDTEVRAVMAAEVEKVLGPVAKPLELDLSHKPHVILVVGVNGTGKTTTIGKLAAKLTDGGLSVMLAAGDTFRAAAIEQLKIWGERTRSPVIATKLGADAAGLAYDAFEKAKEAGSDVLIIDTAGRLQNKAELMAELEKIVRVLGKLDPEAPHTVLQTVDATTGQNALNQVEIFRNIAGVNGLVMTKLDGTARGGILVAIAAKHKLPVYFIGVGEQVDDLEPFSASDFAKAIAGVG